MRAIESTRTSVPYGSSVLARDPRRDRLIPAHDPIRGGLLRPLGPDFRPIASAALRSLAFIALAMLLIFVLLPAALVAAGT
jgi:hypothetical protein